MKNKIQFLRLKYLLLYGVISIASTSCSQDCYEVIEVKQVDYDISNVHIDSAVSSGVILKESVIEYENDNLKHLFNSDFSLSSNYFGTEIIERKSNRRFVKRRSVEYQEKRRYEDHPLITKPKATGNKRLLGSIMCDEYLLESEYKPNLLVYVTEKYPFTYVYNHPYEFPGFVVLRQSYSGNETMTETYYEIRKVNCSSDFTKSINEVQRLMSNK